MDSKRDHRGGHRNIYDQIDLEIINSKGPGPEASSRTKFLLEYSIFFSKTKNFYKHILFVILKNKVRNNFFILHFGRSNCSFGQELQHYVHKFEGLRD